MLFNRNNVSGLNLYKAMMLQTIPVISVTNMQVSLQFYIDVLGFELESVWLSGDKIKWCSIESGGAALVLQEIAAVKPNSGYHAKKKTIEIAICFLCEDLADVYEKLLANGINAPLPVFSNQKWNISLNDPDGFVIQFSSDAQPV